MFNSFFLVIFLFGSVSVKNVFGDSKISYRLPGNVAPKHYDVKLFIRLEPDFDYHGSVGISMKILEKTDLITMHSSALTIISNESFVLRRQQNQNSPDIIRIKTVEHNDQNDFLELQLERPLDVDDYELHIFFTSELEKNIFGLFKTSYINNKGEVRWLAATHLEPTNARRVIPSFDEPQMKATFKVEVTHPSDRHAISNGQLLNINKFVNVSTSIFDTSPVMSPYLLAIVVSDFDGASFEKYSVLSEPDLKDFTKYSLHQSIRAVDGFSNLFDYNYTLPKLDHVSIRTFGGGMENWGLIIYGPSIIIRPNSTENQKRSSLSLLSHEVAHQWFGNLITMDWWSFTWLNEGFAKYYENFMANKLEPSYRYMEVHVVNDIQNILEKDGFEESARSLNEAVESQAEIKTKFDSFTYMKGSAIVRLMSSFFENYDQSIQTYLKDRAYKTAVPDHLYAALTKHNRVPTGGTVKKIMDTWTYQKGHPVLFFNYDSSTGHCELSQKRFLINNSVNKTMTERWWIPLTTATEKHSIFNDTRPIDWMRAEDSSISFHLEPNAGWVMINPEQRVYCRVNYDDANWRRLINFLNSSNFQTIPPISRGQLIDDAMHLARAGHLNYTTALDLVTYLSQEIDNVPWIAGKRNLNFMLFVLKGTNIYDKFNNFVEQLKAKIKITRNWEKTVISNEVEDVLDDPTAILRKFIEKWTEELATNNIKAPKDFNSLLKTAAGNTFFEKSYKEVNEILENPIVKPYKKITENIEDKTQSVKSTIIRYMQEREQWLEHYYDIVENWLNRRIVY